MRLAYTRSIIDLLVAEQKVCWAGESLGVLLLSRMSPFMSAKSKSCEPLVVRVVSNDERENVTKSLLRHLRELCPVLQNER